jgi:hypothetical protein
MSWQTREKRIKISSKLSQLKSSMLTITPMRPNVWQEFFFYLQLWSTRTKFILESFMTVRSDPYVCLMFVFSQLLFCFWLVTETTFNLDSPATLNNQYFILVRFYYSSNEYYVSPHFGGSMKCRGSTFPGNKHNYIWCPYYLPSFMKFCSVVSKFPDIYYWSSSSVQLLWNYWTEFHETW